MPSEDNHMEGINLCGQQDKKPHRPSPSTWRIVLPASADIWPCCSLWVFNRESSDQRLNCVIAAELFDLCVWAHLVCFAKYVHLSPVSPRASGSHHDINSLTGYTDHLTVPPSICCYDLPSCGSSSLSVSLDCFHCHFFLIFLQTQVIVIIPLEQADFWKVKGLLPYFS